MTASVTHLSDRTRDRRTARFYPRKLVLETAAFFRAEGYGPSDLAVFIPASPGRSAVEAAMRRMETRAS